MNAIPHALPDPVQVGLAIRTLRLQRGLRQSDLATASGVARSVITQMEQGLQSGGKPRQSLDLFVIDPIARTLGLSDAQALLNYAREGSLPLPEKIARLAPLDVRNTLGLTRVEMHLPWLLGQLPGVDPEGLRLWTVTDHRQAPQLARGTVVVVDTRVQALTGDGSYLVKNGAQRMLREISLRDGQVWVSTGEGDPAVLTDPADLMVVGRALMVLETRFL